MQIGDLNRFCLPHFNALLRLGKPDCRYRIRIIVRNDLEVSSQGVKVVKTANQLLGMIKRTFSYKTIDNLLPLSLVRPRLEYCMQAWNPHLRKDIDLLEDVQRRAIQQWY